MKTVQTFYDGVRYSNGALVFSGQALGNPIPAQRPANQAPGGLFDLVRIAYNDPDVDWRRLDLDRDMNTGRGDLADAPNWSCTVP